MTISEPVQPESGHAAGMAVPAGAADEVPYALHSGDFEIDGEMLEIFRYEAEELLSGISQNLDVLTNNPDDKNALWEVRRCAHTFKGAAGMVGLVSASRLAHSVEDLLDKLVELDRGASPELVTLIERSREQLTALVERPDSPLNLAPTEDEFALALARIESAETPVSIPVAPSFVPRPIKPPAPVLRISLSRLTELISSSRSLISAMEKLQQSAFAASLDLTLTREMADLENCVNKCIQQGASISTVLSGIRLLRFGNLHARLGAVISATCIEENKKAQFILDTPEVEIDTQIIDSLIEPILHLLRNSIVHGIETPEVRKHCGKPEVGSVRIAVAVYAGWITVTSSDDGAGLSARKLANRAVETGLLTQEKADALSDHEAFQLIFKEGFSTADKLNLSAGRGIGMNIIREAVESHKGIIDLWSEAGVGTTITIRVPESYSTAETDPEISIDLSDANAKPYVLVVDDSATVLRRNADVIEGAEFRVVTATNGAEALNFLASAAAMPAVIISDVEMPVMNGWGFLKNVRDDKRFRSIPFVLVTSLDTKSSRQMAAQLGASGYVIKPLTVECLQKVLSTVTMVADKI